MVQNFKGYMYVAYYTKIVLNWWYKTNQMPVRVFPAWFEGKRNNMTF